ncbi:hypothetical protein Vafri_21113 [Volvox africanus]|uniref:Crinkler (CRN) family protein n=1 Tax=Volvox africanus TaxID=51714 RepID=A0A8J4FDT6_9CHLO|nr:hypothetical protein Vafri_21113 [Volvox africanus]
MALADKTAAGKRIMELYKGDAEMCNDLLSSLVNLDAAKFSEFRDMWVITLGSPVEKLFLEKNLPGKGDAHVGPSSVEAGGWLPSRKEMRQKLKCFWQALLRLDITVDSFLNLPESVFLLGRKTWGSSLYVRPCYRGIFDQMMELYSSPYTINQFLIAGTPGIGKSFFAIVLMGWLVMEKKVTSIVFDSYETRYLFMFKGTDVDVVEGNKMDFKDVIDDDTAWWILDMDDPVIDDRDANIVLLSSPDLKRYNKFVKLPSSTTLYMPIWTDDEIEKCRMQLYPHLSEARVEELVWKWGNVPRYVLKKADIAHAQTSLDIAITHCQWKDVIACIGGPDTAPHASHKLLHLEVVSDKYDKVTVKPASPYVVQKIEENGGKYHVKHLQKLVHLSIGMPMYAAAAGVFFESYAHRHLQEGGSFKVRPLGPSKEAPPKVIQLYDLKLKPCSNVCVFKELKEVKRKSKGIYYVPQNHNFPAVDAIMQPTLLFQMTTVQKTQVHLKGLQAVASRLRVQPPQLFFVVSNDIFMTFRFIPGIPQNIEQWVLKVPWM